MRNPIRLKNLNIRYAPLYAIGLMILAYCPPASDRFFWALPPISLGLMVRSWAAGHLVKNHALTVTGPYAYLRHPLYAGTILIATGFALLPGGWIGWVGLLVTWPWFAWLYFPRKDRTEGARLERLYGATYLRYRDGVSGLWPRRTRWREPGPLDSGQAATQSWSLARYSDNNELGTLIAVLAGLLAFGLRAGLGLP